MPIAATVCFQIILGVLYANLVEWCWHKYVFHGLGKKRRSLFRSHWNKHHKVVRRTGGADENYRHFKGLRKDPMQEVFELSLGAMLHIPLFFIFPYFTIAIWVHTAAYFYIHRRSHLDVGWAKKWVPWHYDHHMGRNQDANWCVTFPFWDYIFNTRVYYLGTDDYTIDEDKRYRRRSKQ